LAFIVANTAEGKAWQQRHQGFQIQHTKSFRRISRNCCRSTYKCRRGVYAKHFEQEDKDGHRFAAQEFKDQMYGGRMLFATFTATTLKIYHTGWMKGARKRNKRHRQLSCHGRRQPLNTQI
jgi:nitroreductase/dihydropteridine reductase